VVRAIARSLITAKTVCMDNTILMTKISINKRHQNTFKGLMIIHMIVQIKRDNDVKVICQVITLTRTLNSFFIYLQLVTEYHWHVLLQQRKCIIMYCCLICLCKAEHFVLYIYIYILFPYTFVLY